MTLYTEQRDDAELTRSADGYSATLATTITRGALTLEGLARLQQAQDLAGVPQYLEAAAGVPALYVRSVTARPLPGGHVRVVATYGPPDPLSSGTGGEDPPGLIEVGATVSTVRTQRDSAGAPIVVSYTYGRPGGAYYGQTIEQGAEVELQVPQAQVSITRRETTRPLDRAIEYVGRVNASSWQGYAPRTWLITAITGSSDDGGESYTVRYELAYAPDTHDPTVAYRDHLEGSGEPPVDVLDQPLATVRPRLYAAAEFSLLGLRLD